jgi:hypothetical protein
LEPTKHPMQTCFFSFDLKSCFFDFLLLSLLILIVIVESLLYGCCFFDLISFSSGGEDGYVRLHHFDSDYFKM